MRWLHDISSVLPVNGEPEARDPSAIDTIVLHCTAMPGWNVWETARYHTGPNHISPDGCPTIAYAYFVEPDGLLYRCLASGVRSWHVGPWNERSIGVCMAYDASDEPPPREQLQAAGELCARLVRELGLAPERVFGHRELEGTGFIIESGKRVQRKECPGVAVDMDAFRSAVAAVLERPDGPDVRDA
ncbi:N-acetylmuramoyl-L-alanine amidase [bacterium]|nr:N-acetylmuramoyl-L-alanine amidase [bacterium]